MLDLSLVACFRDAELYSDAAAFKHRVIHRSDCGLCFTLAAEFEETKASVLIVRIVERNINRINFPKFAKRFHEVLFPHIKHQIAHDDSALPRRWCSFSQLLRLLTFPYSNSLLLHFCIGHLILGAIMECFIKLN